MSVADDLDSWRTHPPLDGPSVDAGPFGELPRLDRRRLRLGQRLGAGAPIGSVAGLLAEGLSADRFEVSWRAAGLKRPGVIAQLSWPRLATRVGLGIEPPLAHALVDRLLGFERLPAEGRLQVTPVEWGILSFVVARAPRPARRGSTGPLGPWDLAVDRLGPDPFDPLGPRPDRHLAMAGPRSAQASASIRLWLPESLLALWLVDDPAAPARPRSRSAGSPNFRAPGRPRPAPSSCAKGVAKLRPRMPSS